MRVYKVQIMFPENDTEYFFYSPLFMDCYIGFKLNLVRRYRISEQTPYKITWFDNEGDRISIFDGDDWRILMKMNGKKVIVEVGYAGIPAKRSTSLTTDHEMTDVVIPAKNSFTLTTDDEMIHLGREFSKKCDVNDKEKENDGSSQIVQSEAIKSKEQESNVPQQESAGKNENIFGFSPQSSYSAQPLEQSSIVARISETPESIGNGNSSKVTTMYTTGKEDKNPAINNVDIVEPILTLRTSKVLNENRDENVVSPKNHEPAYNSTTINNKRKKGCVLTPFNYFKDCMYTGKSTKARKAWKNLDYGVKRRIKKKYITDVWIQRL